MADILQIDRTGKITKCQENMFDKYYYFFF